MQKESTIRMKIMCAISMSVGIVSVALELIGWGSAKTMLRHDLSLKANIPFPHIESEQKYHEDFDFVNYGH